MIHSWGWDGVTRPPSNSAKLWWDPWCLVPASSSGKEEGGREGRRQELCCCLVAHSLAPSSLKVPVSPLLCVSKRTCTDQMTPANVSVGHERFVCMCHYIIGISITWRGRWQSTPLFLCLSEVQHSLPSGKLDISWGCDLVALKCVWFHWPLWNPEAEQI